MKNGFGFIGIIIVCAGILVGAYFMLQSFKQETSVIVPGATSTTTPVQAAEQARTMEENQSLKAAKFAE